MDGIRVESISNAILSAITDANQAGAFTQGVLKSKNSVSRDLLTELGRNVTLYALGGTVEVRATSGQLDQITTKTLDTAKQLFGISNVQANTTITTRQYVQLYPCLLYTSRGAGAVHRRGRRNTSI